MLRLASLEELPAGRTVFQTPFWAYVKQYTGWKPLVFQYGDHSPFLSLLGRRKGMHLLYVPALDPGSITHTGEEFQAVSKEIKSLLPKSTLCVRYDSRTDYDQYLLLQLHGYRNLHLPKHTTQPAETVIIQPTDQPWDAYRRRAQRHIASSRGTVSCFRAEGNRNISRLFFQWYSIYADTSRRAGFLPRSREYLQRILSYRGGDAQAALFCACIGDELVSGALAAWTPSHGCYLYGASSSRGIEKKAMYPLQDFIIRYLNDQSCPYYDLYGIAPAGDENHPLKSLTLFKTAFGGARKRFLGLVDYSYLSLLYRIFIASEKLRITRARGMSGQGHALPE